MKHVLRTGRTRMSIARSMPRRTLMFYKAGEGNSAGMATRTSNQSYQSTDGIPCHKMSNKVTGVVTELARLLRPGVAANILTTCCAANSVFADSHEKQATTSRLVAEEFCLWRS